MDQTTKHILPTPKLLPQYYSIFLEPWSYLAQRGKNISMAPTSLYDIVHKKYDDDD
jgi:hypothetical protein